MRTTIQLTREHRAWLRALAARRGATGIAALVAEALDAYLRAPGDREAGRRRPQRARGRRSAQGEDVLLALRGSGRVLWAEEPADAYVRRLREDGP